MQGPKRALSICLSISLTLSVIDLDGCNKKSDQAPAGQGQAPAATYASPTPDQLYQLVAPIALFPDNLLAQVLAASTYPDQVTAAYNWIKQNPSLKGQQLMQTVDQQQWDASVKGLTQFPDVLSQLATNLSWTSALGDAYFNVPQDVMNAIQVMRQRAYQSGNLKSNQQQNVSVQNQAPGSTPAPSSSKRKRLWYRPRRRPLLSNRRSLKWCTCPRTIRQSYMERPLQHIPDTRPAPWWRAA